MLKLTALWTCALLLAQSPGASAELIIHPPETPPRTPSPPPSGELIRTIEQGGAVAKIDMSGKGAVLCSWSITLSVQAYARGCGWEKVPADEAILASIAKIDAFIIENSLTPVTRVDLERRKQAQAQPILDRITENADAVCKRGEGEFADLAWAMRERSPEQIAAGTAEMLSLPREPVMNPCL